VKPAILPTWSCTLSQLCLKPNTHRRRRRDETVLSRRVGGVYMNAGRPYNSHTTVSTTADGFGDANAQRSRRPWPSLQYCSQCVTTADGCVHTDDTTQLSPTSCEFVFTPPTRLDSFVSSASAVCIWHNSSRLKGPQTGWAPTQPSFFFLYFYVTCRFSVLDFFILCQKLKKKAVLLQRKPREAAVNYYRYNCLFRLISGMLHTSLYNNSDIKRSPRLLWFLVK